MTSSTSTKCRVGDMATRPTMVSEDVIEAEGDSRIPLPEPTRSANKAGTAREDNIKYERDAEGNRIPDVDTGYKLTPESVDFIRKENEQMMGKNHPMKVLPKALRGDKLDRKQIREKLLPKLQFGLGVKNSHLIAYAEKKALMTQDDFLKNTRISLDPVKTIVKALGNACGVTLELHEPYDIDHMYVISLYNSYTPHKSRPKNVERIIKAIQTELKIEYEPMWYFERNDPLEDYPDL